MKCIICNRQIGTTKYYGLCQKCKNQQTRRKYYINKLNPNLRIQIPHQTKQKQKTKTTTTKRNDNQIAEDMMFNHYTRDIKNPKTLKQIKRTRIKESDIN